jgi:trimethylamine-N-oxide reductase (cytochrome c)
MKYAEYASTLDRRAVLRLGVAGSVLAALGPSLLARGARAAGADGEIVSGCHWGIFRASVKDGRFATIKPWEKDPYPSQQLEGVLDSVYSPTRIKYPVVRRAWLEKGPGAAVEERGKGDFVRVSWDKALDLVSTELQRVEKTYGPAATFAGSYGWKSTGSLHNCQTLLRRLMRLKGNFVNSSGDYSTGAAQIIMPHVVGGLEVYEQQTVWPVVADKTDLLVFWSANPVNTNQICWGVADHGAYPGLEAYKKSGKKVIVIDPIRNETARFFNAEWIAPRPQTDVALMLGIAHTLYTEKLHDEKFLKSYTTGFDKFLPYLTGQSDGTPKDAAWAEKISSIPADQIRDLARRFAKNRTMLAGGWAMQRQHHGEQAHWMLVTLASMLGQIGQPGGGFGLSYHYASGGAPAATAGVVGVITDGGKAKEGAAWLTESGAATIPCGRVVDMLLNPGKEFDFNGKRDKYPEVKLAYWVGGNPLAHHPERNRQLEALRKLDTLIVHDFQWTPTARHADIVLPATSAYERNDLSPVGDYSNIAVVAMKKIVDPVFESRNDYDIFAALAKRMGKEQEFTEGKSEMDWLRSFYDVALKQAQTKGVEMPDFDTFWKGDGVFEFPVSDEAKSFVRHAKFREDPLLNPLGTPSGLIEIYSKNIEKMGYDDCPPHPTWMEPQERLGGPSTKYPLHIVSGHPILRLHSQLCGTKLNEKYRIAGREPALMNPTDAAARNIKDGDVVRLFNDRGQILVGVKVTDDARPGVMRVFEGGWYDPAEPGKIGTLDKYGDANVLSLDVGTSRLAQGNTAQTIVAEAEKFTGTPPDVTVFTAPATAS